MNSNGKINLLFHFHKREKINFSFPEDKIKTKAETSIIICSNFYNKYKSLPCPEGMSTGCPTTTIAETIVLG